MSKSNVRLLTKTEREFFKKNYSFQLKDDVLLVKFKSYGRIVAHPINKRFSILSDVRKITISPEAMQLWIDKFKDTNYNVVDVQNAINSLVIGYQGTDYVDVKQQLEFIDKTDAKTNEEIL